MTPDEEALAIAARIADGSGIDWRAADSTPADGASRGVLNQLKAIASLADLHRGWASEPDRDGAPALTQWGALTVIGPIGEGQFGRVYRAWDSRLHRQVALKLLHATSPDIAASPARAIEEARMLAQVRHPNVLTVHGAESIGGQVGIWTEFIDGCTLESLIAGHDPLPAADVIAIGIDLCRALAAVHDAGLLHRDVKAQNVMRETGGRIVLMDFGTSHDVLRAPAREGDLSGTPLYLAPELFRGAQPSVASDIYALAVLLFYISTGKHPVPGRTLDDIRSAHGAARPAGLGNARPELPVELASVIERGLAARPSARYESAREFEAALELVRVSPTHARPASATWWTSRSLAAMLALGLLAATLAAIVWMFNIGGRATRPPAPKITAAATPSPASIIPETAGATPSSPTPVSQDPPASAPPAVPAVQDSAEPLTRKSVIPPFNSVMESGLGRPSADGRFLPLIDPRDDVVIWEIRTGRLTRVTDLRNSEGVALTPLISPTGDRVAYALKVADGAYELLMRDADGTWLRTLIPRQSAYQPIPVDWSRDGEQILCWLSQKDKSLDLVLVPVNGSRMKRIHSDVERRLVRLSPDGRFVVMQRPADPATPARSDLVIIGMDQSAPRLLLEGREGERHPSWTPDGRHVFFLRNSPNIAEGADGWIVPVADGAATGDAVLVAEGLGPVNGDGPVSLISPVGLTDNGSFYRIRSTPYSDVYTAEIDLTSDEFVLGQPARISAQTVGGHQAASWSPDGRSIAYFKLSDSFIVGSRSGRTLIIRDVASGRDRQLQPALPFMGGFSPRWSADSSSVTLWASDREPSERDGFFRVDVLTGEANRVAMNGQNVASQSFQYSPDGREFFYLDRARGIVARNLTTGEERVVVATEASASLGVFALSPDGQSIAFRRTRNGVNTLEVQAMNGTPRTLVTLKDEALRSVDWTPDSQDLLYSKGPIEQRPLWRVSVRGGEPRDTHFSLTTPANSISFSPDGRRVVYTERVALTELWITRSVLGPRQAGSLRSKR